MGSQGDAEHRPETREDALLASVIASAAKQSIASKETKKGLLRRLRSSQ
jgi:hypothetical protein